MADGRLPELRRYWEEARRRGVELSPEQLCRNCPELTDQVRELIAVWETHSSQHGGTWGVVADGSGTPAGASPRPTPAAAPPVSLAAGAEPVAGYRLEAFLGKGSFGEVWRATGPGDVLMALKFIPVQSAAGEGRALELMKRLRHPHLLALFGVWQQDGRLIIASELADGTLADRLVQCQDQGLTGIPATELLEYMHEAAKGIDYLNEPRQASDGGKSGGIQHRDVKPANLLLVGGSVKVADFGLAKFLEKSIATASTAMTPAYAAPEFINGQASRWSDQYSLAVTYCQLRGGRLPFEGNLAALLAGHLMRAPDLEMIPAAERPTVARALAKKPQERWPTCAAFVEALAGAKTRPAPAPRPQPAKASAGPRAKAPPAPVVRARPATPPPRQSFWPVATVAVTLLATVLLALLLLQFSRQPDNGGPRVAEPLAKADIKQPDLKKFPAPKEPPPVLVEEPKEKAPLPKAKDPLPPVPPEPKEKEPPVQAVKLPPILPPEITNSIGMKLKLIPKGKFRMGSPASEEGHELFDKGHEEEHDVEITQPFYMGVYEVTQAQYQKVMGENPSWFSAKGGGKATVAGLATGDFPVETVSFAQVRRVPGRGALATGDFPVETVSWEDAVEFCKRLSALAAEQKAGRVYHLPTEAEWEYTCRGGPVSSPAPFHFLKPSSSLSFGQANFGAENPYGGGTKGKGLKRTCRVGSYEPNRLGLYDMHGNAWEWCQDWYDKDYYKNSPITDPQGPKSSSENCRVLRGGSWVEFGIDCRTALRFRVVPGARGYSFGFRVVFRLGVRTP